MVKDKKYNYNSIVSVELEDSFISERYTYKQEKRFLGIRLWKKGFYDCDWFLGGDYCGVDAPEHYFIKNDGDGKVYHYSSVTICFADGYSSKTIYFDDYDKAKNYYNELTSTGRWI